MGMKEDFKNPNSMSFKDYLAIAFSGSYLVMLWLHFVMGIGDKDALSLLNTNIGIILTGYFVHEVTRLGTDAYRENKQIYREKGVIEGEHTRSKNY